MTNKQCAEVAYQAATNTLECHGDWSITTSMSLNAKLEKIRPERETSLEINGSELTYFDSASALLLVRYLNNLHEKGHTYKLSQFSNNNQKLFDIVLAQVNEERYVPPVDNEGVLESIGKETVFKLSQMDGFVILVGELCDRFFYGLMNFRQLQWPSIMATMGSAGVRALPIVGLLSFLIGVVLAYQMGLQLKTYGANAFISMITGLAIFREFGPLITAIIIAGRTSSAFTAHIGSMKVNEELDALKTMGLSSVGLLVLPRVIGMLLVFPLLIFWSDLFGILGSMIMSKYLLDINFSDFLIRIKTSVGLDQFMLGMYKAPVYALITSLVGCYQGFMVESNSASIGTQTTKSVVQALFLIIIADAIYSIIYSWMGV